MKRLLWGVALGAAMLGGCAKEQPSAVVDARATATAGAHGRFTSTRPPQRRLKPVSTPLYFETNVGQTDASALFMARGPGYSLFLTRTGAVFGLAAKPVVAACRTRQPCTKPAPGTDVVQMSFVGANPEPATQAQDRQPGRSNYFLGNNRARWHRNVAQYAKVRYRKVYSGIDVVFYGHAQALEYDFVVAPGADPRQIALDMTGVRSMHIDPIGDLVLTTAHGELRQHKPVVYQQLGNQRVAVEGRYTLRPNSRVGFELGRYDTGAPLVIDPMFGFSTYLGGSTDDRASAVAVDGQGNTYVTGYTGSIDFPLVAPMQDRLQGEADVFVAKFDQVGNLVYNTYLGGTSDDDGASIAVDASGHAYVAGTSCSSDFPVVNAAQSAYGGSCDAFVAKLQSDGSVLDYSTYVGGSGHDGYDDVGASVGPYSVKLAIDGDGSAYITGATNSLDFPTVNAFQPNSSLPMPNSTASNAYVVKLAPDGGSFAYSTYLSGSQADESGHGIAVGVNGNAYVIGYTGSADFPLVDGWQAAKGSSNYGDAFVAEFSADGSSLVYSSYLGGSVSDLATAITVDPDGNAYVTGTTSSPDFPFTVFPSDCPGSALPHYTDRAFITKIRPAGSGLEYSACLKSANPADIAIDAVGNLYLTGWTTGTNLPTKFPMQAQLNPNDDFLPRDAFISELSPDGATLLFSTYLGGNHFDAGTGVAVDGQGSIHVVGITTATDFPVTNGSAPTEDPALESGTYANAFVARIDDGAGLYVTDFGQAEGSSGDHTVTFTVRLSSPSDVPVTFAVDTSDVTATEGIDYEAVHQHGLVIGAGQTQKTVSMTFRGDTEVEAHETFFVDLSNVQGATVAHSHAIGTIGNDDAIIWVDNMAVPEGSGNSVTPVSVPVRLSAPVWAPVSIELGFADDSANLDWDYSAGGGPWQLVIPPGANVGYATVDVIGDNQIEENETFHVLIDNVVGATASTTREAFTILNDDTAISIADASFVEGNSGAKTADFTVSLAQPSVNPVQFDLSTTNGTATAGSDFTSTTLTGIVIAPGSTSTTVSIPVTGDTGIEGDETFGVSVSNVTGATVSDGVAVGTILNDDTRLSIADTSIVEGNSGTRQAAFTIKLSNPSASPVRFSVATAGKTATSGTDFVARSVSGLVIPAHATSAKFTMTIKGDRTIEPNESFLVNLSGVTGATVSDGQAVGTIRNDDTALSIADAKVAEGNSGARSLVFTIKLSAPSASPVTFNIATASKTALAGSDFVARSLTGQVIAAGATSKTFAVTVRGDTAREASETFAVNVSNVVGATVTDGQAIGTIANDD